jgi:hypothetical protein
MLEMEFLCRFARRTVFIVMTTSLLLWLDGQYADDDQSMSAAPTVTPTEHATYLSSAAMGTGITIEPNIFYGPYAVHYGEVFNLKFNTTTCDDGFKIFYVYLEVLQGDGNLVLLSESASNVGSDYMSFGCTGALFYEGAVHGAFGDPATVDPVYAVTTLFQVYATVSTTAPIRSPFDSLQVVHHLGAGHPEANVYMEYGSYSFFQYEYNANNPAGLSVRCASMSDSSFSMMALITTDDRLPRMYTSANVIGLTSNADFQFAAVSYQFIYEFDNSTMGACIDSSNCTVYIGILNQSPFPISVDVRISSYVIVPGISYGPFSCIGSGTDHYILKDFCQQTKFAHIFLEGVNGNPQLVVNYVVTKGVAGGYVTYDPAVCAAGQEHLHIGIHSKHGFGTQTIVYKLEVLLETSGAIISSPFDESESIVYLEPDVPSTVINPTESFFYLRWHYTGPALLLVINLSGQSSASILACLGSGISRPTTMAGACIGGDAASIVSVSSSPEYVVVWNITKEVGLSHCPSAVNCTLTASAIALEDSYDDSLPCLACGLHFLLTTQHVSDYAAALTVPPVASPTASPTPPTRKPTHKPTATPTIHPSHRPTASLGTPTPGPTVQPTISPTAGTTTRNPTTIPTLVPSAPPSRVPSAQPTAVPTTHPTVVPSSGPTVSPTAIPTPSPSTNPTTVPTPFPTDVPSVNPSAQATVDPTAMPSATPSASPTVSPTVEPTAAPTTDPTVSPTVVPTAVPSADPTTIPSVIPSASRNRRGSNSRATGRHRRGRDRRRTSRNRRRQSSWYSRR